MKLKLITLVGIVLHCFGSYAQDKELHQLQQNQKYKIDERNSRKSKEIIKKYHSNQIPAISESEFDSKVIFAP